MGVPIARKSINYCMFKMERQRSGHTRLEKIPLSLLKFSWLLCFPSKLRKSDLISFLPTHPPNPPRLARCGKPSVTHGLVRKLVDNSVLPTNGRAH